MIREFIFAINNFPFQTKEVIATPFEGCRFTWNKMITERFQASHTINMSSFKPANYKFGATYVGGIKLGANEQYPILIRLVVTCQGSTLSLSDWLSG